MPLAFPRRKDLKGRRWRRHSCVCEVPRHAETILRWFDPRVQRVHLHAGEELFIFGQVSGESSTHDIVINPGEDLAGG